MEEVSSCDPDATIYIFCMLCIHDRGTAASWSSALSTAALFTLLAQVNLLQGKLLLFSFSLWWPYLGCFRLDHVRENVLRCVWPAKSIYFFEGKRKGKGEHSDPVRYPRKKVDRYEKSNVHTTCIHAPFMCVVSSPCRKQNQQRIGQTRKQHGRHAFVCYMSAQSCYGVCNACWLK